MVTKHEQDCQERFKKICPLQNTFEGQRECVQNQLGNKKQYTKVLHKCYSQYLSLTSKAYQEARVSERKTSPTPLLTPSVKEANKPVLSSIGPKQKQKLLNNNVNIHGDISVLSVKTYKEIMAIIERMPSHWIHVYPKGENLPNLFHGTSSENKEDILEKGLLSLAPRSVRDFAYGSSEGVYLTSEIWVAQEYGDLIFEINFKGKKDIVLIEDPAQDNGYYVISSIKPKELRIYMEEEKEE